MAAKTLAVRQAEAREEVPGLSGTSVINGDNETKASLASKVDRYFALKAKVDKYTAEAKALAAELAAEAQALQDRDGFAGEFASSYALSGNERRADVVFADKWKIIDEEALVAALGDHAEDLLETVTKVALKPEVNKFPAVAQVLRELLGAAYDTFLTETKATATVKGFNRAVYDAVDAEGLEAVRAAARQDAPAIRKGA